jgi:hypothetical protein
MHGAAVKHVEASQPDGRDSAFLAVPEPLCVRWQDIHIARVAGVCPDSKPINSTKRDNRDSHRKPQSHSVDDGRDDAKHFAPHPRLGNAQPSSSVSRRSTM